MIYIFGPKFSLSNLLISYFIFFSDQSLSSPSSVSHYKKSLLQKNKKLQNASNSKNNLCLLERSGIMGLSSLIKYQLNSCNKNNKYCIEVKQTGEFLRDKQAPLPKIYTRGHKTNMRQVQVPKIYTRGKFYKRFCHVVSLQFLKIM